MTELLRDGPSDSALSLVLAHGAGAGMRSPFMQELAQGLGARGVAVVRFEFPYLLAAYQLPWLGLEPFAYGEINHFVSPYGDEQSALSLGLNIHFTPYAQLKTQIAKIYFFDLNDKGNFGANDFTLLFSRLAVAF